MSEIYREKRKKDKERSNNVLERLGERKKKEYFYTQKKKDIKVKITDRDVQNQKDWDINQENERKRAGES